MRAVTRFTDALSEHMLASAVAMVLMGTFIGWVLPALVEPVVILIAIFTVILVGDWHPRRLQPVGYTHDTGTGRRQTTYVIRGEYWSDERIAEYNRRAEAENTL